MKNVIMDERVKLINSLISKISKGDTDALDKLFEEVGGLMFLMAKKYLLDKSLAEDLVSEIFSRLVKRSKSFDVKKNGLNWLYKSIHNEAINWNKKTNPHRFGSLDDHKELTDILPPPDGQIDKLILRDALKTLSETENRILYYKFWEGLTVRDIAKKIKKPRSTVQDTINKALEKMREIIEPDNSSEIR